VASEAEEQRRLAMFAMGALKAFDATPAGAEVRAALIALQPASAAAAPPPADAAVAAS